MYKIVTCLEPRLSSRYLNAMLELLLTRVLQCFLRGRALPFVLTKPMHFPHWLAFGLSREHYVLSGSMGVICCNLSECFFPGRRAVQRSSSECVLDLPQVDLTSSTAEKP